MPPNPKNNGRDSYKLSIQDTGKLCFEIKVSSGTISWVNDNLKGKCLEDDRTLLNSSIYGLVDESFRARLSSILNEYEAKDIPRKTLWPIPTSKGKMAWWMVNIEYTDEEYFICSTYLVLLTDKSELGYKFASLSADNTFLASVAMSEIKSLRRDFDAFRKSVSDEVKASKDQINAAVEASRKAEKAAILNKEATDDLRKHVISQFSEHTKEITKLMTSDVVHDSRMAIFEDHVKKTTSEALTRIVQQANQSGRGLSKKVTVPVGISAVVVGILQWIITKYFGGASP